MLDSSIVTSPANSRRILSSSEIERVSDGRRKIAHHYLDATIVVDPLTQCNDGCYTPASATSNAETFPGKRVTGSLAISGVSAPERWFFFDAFVHTGFE